MTSCAGLQMTPDEYYEATRPEAADEYGDYLSARYAGLVRDGRSASEYYAQALSRSPEDKALLERAVIYALVAGDTSGAMDLVRNAPNDVEHSNIVETLIAVDQFSKRKFSETISFDATASSSSVMQAAIARSLREWSELGLKDKQRILPVSQSSIESRVFRSVRLYSDGLLELASGMDDEAKASFEEAWKLKGRYPVGVDAYVRLLAEQGDHKSARSIVDQFYEEIGDNPLIDQVDRELRDNALILAPRMSPNEGAAASVLGYALAIAAKQGDDIANLYYSFVLMFDEKQDAARLLLADSMRGAERYQAALEQLQFIKEDSVYFGAARAREAWVHCGLEDDQAAIDVAKTSLATQPGRSLKMQIGDLYRNLEMFPEAEALFDEVANTDRKEGFVDWRVLFARAGMRDKLGRWDDAEQDLLLALSLEPTRPEILNYLGYSWVDRGVHIDQGFEMIRTAMEQRPNEGYIRDSLGWAYYRLNHYEKAVVYLEQAAELDPADPIINDHLGDAYWRIGRKQQAEYQWLRVLKYSEDDELKEIVGHKLKSGLDIKLSAMKIH